MPTYDYHCCECQHHLEKHQKISEAPLKNCPECGKKSLKRGPGGGVGLIFKGSGFYITDYSSKKNASEKSSTASEITQS